MQSTVTVLISNLLFLAPTLLIYVGGMVFAAVRWRTAPRAALLAMIGLAVMLLSTLGGTFFQTWLITSGRPPSSIGQIFGVVNLALSAVRSAGLMLVILAVFAERRTSHGFDVTAPAPARPLAEVR